MYTSINYFESIKTEIVLILIVLMPKKKPQYSGYDSNLLLNWMCWWKNASFQTLGDCWGDALTSFECVEWKLI